MRRLLLTAAGLAALTLSAPGVALANHGHRHHHKRHANHAKFRFEHVGPTGTSTTGAPSGPSTPTTPTTPPAPENAGKVASYTGGVLTLTLNDNSSVSGKVTNATHIECVSATPPAPAPPVSGQGDDSSPGDDSGEGGEDNQGDQQGDGPPSAPSAGAPQWVHGEDGSGDGENPAAGEPPCDTSALVAGAVVREAELRIGPGGTEFESIELVR